jgi:hypothetical protein
VALLTYVNLRYLTKITDQVLALASPEHARALDFNKFSTYDSTQSGKEVEEDYNEDRMFSFSVAKKNEQSEDVTAYPGFEVCLRAMSLTVIFMRAVFQLFSRQLRMAERLSQCPIEHQSALQPSLVASETSQAFLAVEYQPGAVKTCQLQETMTDVHLKSFLE